MLDISSSNKENKSSQNPATLVTESEILGLNRIDTGKVIKIFAFIVLGMFVAMSIFLFAIGTSRETQFSNKESNYNNLLNQLNSDKELTSVDKLVQKFDNGFSKISGFITKRPMWSVFLQELQAVAPNDVIYKSVSVNEKTYITTINGETSSYNSVSLLLATMRGSNKFSNIKLISSSQVEGSTSTISFSIETQIVTANLKSETNK